MTPISLPRLIELARAATPGPWSYDVDEDEIHADSCSTQDGEPWHVIPSQQTGYFTPKNAAFIAAANPATVIALAEALRDSQEALSLILMQNENFVEDAQNNIYRLASEALARIASEVKP